MTSGEPNQPKDITCYLTFMLVPNEYLCVQYCSLHALFQFLPMASVSENRVSLELSLFGTASIKDSYPFSWLLNLLPVVCGEAGDTAKDRPLSTTLRQSQGTSFSWRGNCCPFQLVEPFITPSDSHQTEMSLLRQK